MRRLVVVVLAIGMVGCGNDSPTAPTVTTTTLPPRSALSISSTPAPVVAGPGGTSGGVPYPFGARFSVVVSETAGLACNVNRVVMLFPGTNNTIAYGAADVQTRAGANFVAAGGTLTIPFSIVYGPNRQQLLIVSVEVIDARGNLVTGTTNVQMQ